MREYDSAQPSLRVNLGVQGRRLAAELTISVYRTAQLAVIGRHPSTKPRDGVEDLCNTPDGRLCKRRQIVL